MKRIIFVTGHYGSGKSEFSVNLAIAKKVRYLIDLDIVNPYFRTRELETLLTEHSIRMISSTVENALGSDLPFISGEAFLPFRDENSSAVYDLGGDSVGARLLRQFTDLVKPEEVELLFCINVYREFTSTKSRILSMISEIEGSGGLKVTGFINNSNFLRDTTYEDLIYGERIITEVCEATGLKIQYTGVYEDILKKCGPLAGEIIPLKLFLRKKWL